MAAATLSPVDLLAIRLGGSPLEPPHWRQWAQGLRAGQIAPYQHAALQVSCAIRPLINSERTAALAAIDGTGLAGPLGHALRGLGGIGAPDIFGRAMTGDAPGDADLPGILATKINGEALSDSQIAALVASIAYNKASDAQVAAFTTAVFMRGMNPSEIASLTREMTHTGDVLELGALPGPILDKHSTGGVGDKVSLPLAAVLAACGAYVPMVSGRGLGHTGGTLDKLQSIPGFTVNLDPDQIRSTVRDVGAVIVGQTATLAPADRRMYAIRDVTATVGSIPLITASILSKKLAEGLDALCMDVKVGSGAFMRSVDDARTLAKSLVDVGGALSEGDAPLKVRALLTGMDRPLGSAIGNALEVRESIACLKGGGPEDVRTLVVAIASRLLMEGGLVSALPAGVSLAAKTLKDGSALNRFGAMVDAQGGDTRVLTDERYLPSAPLTHVFTAPTDGFVLGLDALTLGKVVVALGGGRRVAEDLIDPSVGLEVLSQVGAPVSAGQPLIRIHAGDKSALEEAMIGLSNGVLIGQPGDAPPPLPLIIAEVT